MSADVGSSANDDFVRVDHLPEVQSGKVSRATIFRAVKAGTIPAARLGRFVFVHRDFIALAARGDNK